MCDRFCHLHNHTEYSLLDGANRIPDLVARAKQLGMPALAITDHGAMFGAVEFYNECKSQGIKPILGVEAYVAPQGIHQKKGDGEKSSYHMVLLAKNLEGYRNLCHLTSIAALQGFYHKPRIDHDLIRQYSGGLIATSACMSSEICVAILNGRLDEANYLAGMYKEIFGDGNFYIELMDHGLPRQAELNEKLAVIAQQNGLPMVVTNDAHYLCQEHHDPHDTLLCIQTGKLKNNPDRMRFERNEWYLKTQAEMAALFPDHGEALENTMRIAEQCQVELEKRSAPMPTPEVPDGMDSFAYLTQLAEQGLREKAKDPEASLERLQYELDVIKTTGFGDYFLIVREFAQEAKRKGIYHGVRGSAAGSMVSYCIGITDVDPVEYGLTFERFLNPERVSMPDVDMDFEDARRDEIVQYVVDRFGSDRVAQIITFGTLGAKAAIKDCGRVLGYEPRETERLTKMIPQIPGMTLSKAYKEIAEFRATVDGEVRSRELYEKALQIEGFRRNSGVHAAGLVISQEPLMDYIPLTRGNDGQVVTAYEMGILEKLKMLKVDFLGLSNLTVIARCVANVAQTRGETIDPLTLEDGDPEAYAILARGETVGIFQMESAGMTRWVMQLKPQNVRELAAMIALYRPGPMDHIPQYIATKRGKQAPDILHPLMEPVLRETYGVIVYQDQVMQIVQAVAGFTLGKADVLRRAMGKKSASALASLKPEFYSGAKERGVSEEVAERIWQRLEPFAGYAFNKAHAVCYSILSYRTAYLKAHYPTEYMAALLSAFLSNESKVTTFIEECRRMKIAVVQPDINRSQGDFSVEAGKKGNAIRFGLVAIKGVGESLVQGILKEREENGPFTHLYEFAERTKGLGMNRTALDALIKAGAFDSIDKNRKRLLDHLEGALHFGDIRLRERLNGQESLFGGGGEESSAQVTYPDLPHVEPPGRTDILRWEKDVMGLYISDHPLRGMERTLRAATDHTCLSAQDAADGTGVRLAGVIAKLAVRTTKKDGKKMASLVLEDFSGQIACTAFPAAYQKFEKVLVKDAVVVIDGAITYPDRPGDRTIELRVDRVTALDPVAQVDGATNDATGFIRIQVQRATQRQIRQLRELLESAPGEFPCEVEIMQGDFSIPIPFPFAVDPSPDLVQSIQRNLAKSRVEVIYPEIDV
ncbi:MAG: DNA polymerase III subunit alpha [Fimbriimonadaceae bacterium]|nr:DNA polymerase III subunit alpha [Fimbriimonadaceae bacterium]